MSHWGKNVSMSVFGQSHASAIGVTIDGLPAGEPIDMDELQAFMAPIVRLRISRVRRTPIGRRTLNTRAFKTFVAVGLFQRA